MIGRKLYVFDKDSSTPSWSYLVDRCDSLAISQDGKYIALGSDGNIILFSR